MNEHTSARSFDQAISRAIGAIEAWAAPKLSLWRQVKTDLMSAWERLASEPNEEGFRDLAAILRRHGVGVILSRWTPSEDDLLDPRTRPWARCRLALQAAMAGQFDQAVMFASDIDPLEWSLLMELAPLRLLEAWFAEHATEWAAALFAVCDVERVAKIAGSGWLSEDAKFLIASVRPHCPMAESGQQPAEPATTPKRRRVSKAEAEVLVRDWLAENAKGAPESVTRDAVAAGTGVSAGLVSRTAAWRAFAAERRRRRGKEVALTDKMLAIVPAKARTPEQEAELAELVRQQQAEEVEQIVRHSRRHGRRHASS